MPLPLLVILLVVLVVVFAIFLVVGWWQKLKVSRSIILGRLPEVAPVGGGVSSLGVRKVRWGCQRDPLAGSACRPCRRRSRCGSAPSRRAGPQPRQRDRRPLVGCGSSRPAQAPGPRAWVGPLHRRRSRSAGGAGRLARGPRNRGRR